jgi:copper chaperone CopZ
MRRPDAARALALIAALLCVPALGLTAPKTSTVTVSLVGMDCSGCWQRAEKELRGLSGVSDVAFDSRVVEATVTVDGEVPFDSLRAAVERAGFEAHAGAGQGRWTAPKGYPEGADVGIVSHDGSDIGDLAALAVPGKVTIVDLYADWCAPCRMIDRHLSTVLAGRSDVAVRKVNIVKWGTPAAKRYLGRRPSIPLVYVYGRDGTPVAEVLGFRPRELDAAIDKGAAVATSSGSPVVPTSK